MDRIVQARIRKYKPKPENLFEAQIMPGKTRRVKLGLKNLTMLPSYFDYFFVRQRPKVRLRSKLSPKYLSAFGPNPTQKARPDLQLWCKHHKHVFHQLRNLPRYTGSNLTTFWQFLACKIVRTVWSLYLPLSMKSLLAPWCVKISAYRVQPFSTKKRIYKFSTKNWSFLSKFWFFKPQLGDL